MKTIFSRIANNDPNITASFLARNGVGRNVIRSAYRTRKLDELLRGYSKKQDSNGRLEVIKLHPDFYKIKEACQMIDSPRSQRMFGADGDSQWDKKRLADISKGAGIVLGLMILISVIK